MCRARFEQGAREKAALKQDMRAHTTREKCAIAVSSGVIIAFLWFWTIQVLSAIELLSLS